jgi:hypothetical protein
MLLESVAGRGTGDASLHARLTALIAQWRATTGDETADFFLIECADALDAALGETTETKGQ